MPLGNISFSPNEFFFFFDMLKKQKFLHCFSAAKGRHADTIPTTFKHTHTHKFKAF